MADEQPDPHKPQVTEARPSGKSEGVKPSLHPELKLGKAASPRGPAVVHPAQEQDEEQPQQPEAEETTPTSGATSINDLLGYPSPTGQPQTIEDLLARTPSGAATAGTAGTPATPASLRVEPQQYVRPEGLRGNLHDIIRQGATEEGIDPAYALATAERESTFNPNEGGTGTIRGMYQMSGPLRYQHGIGESTDPYVQTRGFGAFTKQMRGEMNGVLGRDPTWDETYAGHHFGGTRAARMINGQIPPNTPVQAVFSPLELRGNPHIVRAGTTGNLLNQTTSDMQRRMGKYGGGGTQEPDFSAFGTEPDTGQAPATQPAGQQRSDQLNPADRAAVDAWYPPSGSNTPDLSAFGSEATP